MFTNFHGNIFPDGCVGARFASGGRSGMFHAEEVEGEDHWSSHLICMDGEPDVDEGAENEMTENMHGIHLI